MDLQFSWSKVSPKNGWLPGRQREKTSARSNSKNEIFMSEVSHQLLVNYLGRPDMKLGIFFPSFCLREIFEDFFFGGVHDLLWYF